MINKYFIWKEKAVFIADLLYQDGEWKLVVYDCISNSADKKEHLLWHPYRIEGTPYLVNMEEFNYSVDLTAPCDECIYCLKRTVCPLEKKCPGAIVPERVSIDRCKLRQDCLSFDANFSGLYPVCAYRLTSVPQFSGEESQIGRDALLLRSKQLIKGSTFVFVPALSYYPLEQELYSIFWETLNGDAIIYSLALDRVFERPSEMVHVDWHIKSWTTYCKRTFSKAQYYSDITNYDLGYILISFDSHRVVFCPGGEAGYYITVSEKTG